MKATQVIFQYRTSDKKAAFFLTLLPLTMQPKYAKIHVFSLQEGIGTYTPLPAQLGNKSCNSNTKAHLAGLELDQIEKEG